MKGINIEKYRLAIRLICFKEQVRNKIEILIVEILLRCNVIL